MGSVLLVESDPETRERFGFSLRDAGHEVLYAVTSRDAFHRVCEGGIDVIVVDAYDPIHRMGGTVELARNLNSLPDAPPIILLSGSPDAPEISARIGATAFLPKPCDPVDLLAAVRRSTGNIRPRTFDDEPTGPARIYE